MSTIVPVTCAIITHKDQILCTQRSTKMAHPGKWEFPGGKIEQDESPESCIRREIKEELDIEISILEPIPSVRHAYQESRIIELIPFICSYTSGEIKLKEHQQYLWLPVERLGELDWAAADLPIVAYMIAMTRQL
jgi:8-oxo-dGTP diphosphatase